MAGGSVSYKITETGYNELRAKLKDPDGIFGPPYRTAMGQIRRAALQSVQAAAPIGATGRLANSIRAFESTAKIPRYVKVSATARNDRGFGYSKTLEFSMFAQNRYRKGTNRHRHWMRRAIDRIRPLVDAAFKAADAGVQREWLK